MTQDYPQSTGSIGQQTHGGQSQQGPMGRTSERPQSMGPSQGMQSSMGTSQMGQPGGRTATGTQMGPTSTGSAHQMTHQKVGQQFESELTPELNEALEAFDRVVEIASWCADKCIENPQMAECTRLCLDLAELAELNEKLIARDSINGPEIAETYLQVAQQGLPILQQYQQMPAVQETLEAVTHAIDSTNKLLNAIGGQQGFQEMAQQMSQQPQGQMSQQPQGQMGHGGQSPF